MARKRTCTACDGDYFKRVTVTLPSGKVRDTDFVYCCRCLVVFYTKPDREVQRPPNLPVDLLQAMSAAAIYEAMQKLPDPNSTDSDAVSIQHYVSYHGTVRFEFERATAGTEGATWRYWRAKAATKAN